MHQNIYADMVYHIRRSKRRSVFRRAVSIMACIVMFCTTYALILPAITMEPNTFCGVEEHTHGEECYSSAQQNVLICSPANLDIHTHGDGCYGPEGEIICGQCDYVAHAHDDSCRNASGEVVCTLEERSVHIHGDSCFMPGETLPEVLHVHSDGCNVLQRGDLTCTQEELEGHTHGDACYEPGDVLLCSLPENHIHDDSCYRLPLNCGISTDPHVHGTGCYSRGSQICSTPEGHVHGDGCLETVSICRNAEEDHAHDDSCYETRTICQTPENHSHGDGCYESIVVCGREAGEQHTHGDGCYGTVPELICTEAENHVHSGSCYEPRLICPSDEFPGHAHGDDCYEQVTVIGCGLNEGEPEPTEPAEPVLVCTETAAQVHVHGDGCFETVTVDSAPICGNEADGHEHTFECYILSCGLDEHEHSLACYSDPEADVESQATWEATMASVTLTGDRPTDVVAIAKSQLGYTESTRNYAVWEDDSIHGYTRYGAWYGVPYGDWCGMFASFCLRYAGVYDIPINYGVRPWIEELSALGLYYRAWETKPQVGSLIFYDWEGDGLSDHVGIVAEVHEADEYSGASITAIEGNASNCVQYVTYATNDSVILGYGLLPGQEPIPVTAGDSEFQVNMDITQGPVVILTVEKAAAEEMVPEEGSEERAAMFTLSSRAVQDLKTYLVSVGGAFTIKLTDGENNMLPKDNNGNYIVEPGIPYELTLTVDSPKGFAPGTYVYQLPSGLDIQDGSGDLVADNKKLGSWTISEDGLITLVFDQVSDQYVSTKLSAQMGITFEASDDIIDFDGIIKVVIKKPPDEGEIDINLAKWGGPSEDGNSLNWNVRITGYEGATIPGTVITDRIKSGNHYYTEADMEKGLRFTARIYNSATGSYTNHEWVVSRDDPNLTWTATGWTYTMPTTVTCNHCGQITLGNDWEYDIYYSSTHEKSNANGTVFYSNHVDFGDYGIDGNAQIKYGTGTMGVEKTGNFQGDTEGGKFVWTVTVNLPGMAEGQKAAFEWKLTDGMGIKDALGNDLELGENPPHNDMDKAVATITRNGETTALNRIENATAADDIVWSSVGIGYNDYIQHIYFYCRCQCTEANCAKWENGACTDKLANGFCKCWTITDDAEIIFRYETDAPTIISDYGENGKYITNQAELWVNGIWQAIGGAQIKIPSLFEKDLLEDFTSNDPNHPEKEYIASYTITVNEQKLDLSPDGTPITIVDKMTDTLVYIAGSMVITEENLSGQTKVLTPGTDYTLSYDGSDRPDKRHVLTIVLNHPKQAMYTLKYDTSIKIKTDITENTYYQNWAEVTIWGEHLEADTEEKVYTDINFVAKSYQIDIVKTADGTDVLLPGATFGLYNENGRLITSQTTDAQGKLSFVTSITEGIILLEHTPYYIQEISAPEGFILDTTKYWFFFCDQGTECTEGYEILQKYNSAVRIPGNKIETFNLKNTMEGYVLPETGGTGTIPYTMAGLLLILLSTAFLMYRSKARRREEY